VPIFAVHFTLDAADHVAAETTVGEWTTTPGSHLVSIVGTAAAPATEGLPQEVPPTGDVGDALDKAGGVTLFLYRLEPESVTQGVGQVQLHLHGEGFTSAAVIVFAGTELATAYVSATELYCTIDASTGGHAPGTFDVAVRQDAQETKALPFTIAPAAV
jgi:hypothetical protein